MVNLQCVLLGVLQNYLFGWNVFHTGYIDMVSSQSVISGILVDFHSEQNFCQSGGINMVSPQYVSFGDVIDFLSVKIYLSHCLHWFGFPPVYID